MSIPSIAIDDVNEILGFERRLEDREILVPAADDAIERAGFSESIAVATGDDEDRLIVFAGGQ